MLPTHTHPPLSSLVTGLKRASQFSRGERQPQASLSYSGKAEKRPEEGALLFLE